MADKGWQWRLTPETDPFGVVALITLADQTTMLWWANAWNREVISADLEVVQSAWRHYRTTYAAILTMKPIPDAIRQQATERRIVIVTPKGATGGVGVMDGMEPSGAEISHGQET
jgi:hypothetical protein